MLAYLSSVFHDPGDPFLSPSSNLIFPALLSINFTLTDLLSLCLPSSSSQRAAAKDNTSQAAGEPLESMTIRQPALPSSPEGCQAHLLCQLLCWKSKKPSLGLWQQGWRGQAACRAEGRGAQLLGTKQLQPQQCCTATAPQAKDPVFPCEVGRWWTELMDLVCGYSGSASE